MKSSAAAFATLALCFGLLGAISGCGSDDDSASGTPATTDGGTEEAAVAANRGPTSVAIDGDPNGLFWDDASQTLYIADDGNNRILSYKDGPGIALVANLPAAPAMGPGLGQVIRETDGTLLVTRFGYGTAGDIAIVHPDGSTSTIPNLDVTKRRIGLTVAADGTLFDSYFTKLGTSTVGAVAKLTTAGVETDVITSLVKPVGVLAVGTTLFADDQVDNTLLSAPLDAVTTKPSMVAMLPDADLPCVGPNGTLYSGGSDGNVRQISATGEVSVFASGFAAARGVAYDPTNKRLFVANHATVSTLEIRPVP